MPGVLIADDDAKHVSLLKGYLEQECYQVYTASNGIEALRMYKILTPNYLLSEVRLPGLNGFEICRQVRANSNIPILVYSALSHEVDRIIGLEVGADAYLQKPFSMRELLARMHALERRIWLDQNFKSAHYNPRNITE